MEPYTGKDRGDTLMFKRRTALSVLLVAALLVAATPAFAIGSVTVYPTFDDEYEAKIGDTLHLTMGWMAATKGQVRVFIRHSSDTLTLVGPRNNIVWSMSAGEADAYWGPLEPAPDEWLGLDCPMPTLWIAWWDYDIPDSLTEAGTYTLFYTGTFDQPVNDGLHACVELPGTEPIPTPSLYRGEVFAISTIVVAAPPPP